MPASSGAKDPVQLRQPLQPLQGVVGLAGLEAGGGRAAYCEGGQGSVGVEDPAHVVGG